MHDQIIWNLHVNGIDELLLFLGSNPEEVRGRERELILFFMHLFLQSQWCMHVLEITFLMLKEQVPAYAYTCYDIDLLLILSCPSPLKLWPGQGVHEQLPRRRKMKSEKPLLNP